MENLTKDVDVRASFARLPLPSVDLCDIAWVTINTLPDVALLEIFDFYVEEASIDAWYTLVHVCRKWRNVVFGSPRRLDLRLECTASTPVREILNVWPVLPIAIRACGYELWHMGNITAALKHEDRIYQLDLLDISSSQLQNVLAAMQQPFPALTHLQLRVDDETLVAPASFLGGSVPSLQSLRLCHIPFPGLPKLLLSTTLLTDLDLRRIPHSGYISPESMVTSLSMLTRLKRLFIEFESPRCRPDRQNRRSPPLARILLPVLAELQFRGVAEYLEDLVARIDAPQLDDLNITFFHQLIFHTPQLTQFISRTPNFKTHDDLEARVVFSDKDVSITLPQASNGWLHLETSCRRSDWQLSSLTDFCSTSATSFPQTLIPAVEHLYIQSGFPQPRWQNDIENNQWLELLHSFTAAKGLYISQAFTPRIVPALQELVGERVTEVLPALQTLFLETLPGPGPVREAIGLFVTARQLAGHPIAVSRWQRESDELYESGDEE